MTLILRRGSLLLLASFGITSGAAWSQSASSKVTPDQLDKQLEKGFKCGSARIENEFLGKASQRSIRICHRPLGSLVVIENKKDQKTLDRALESMNPESAVEERGERASSPGFELCKTLKGSYRPVRLTMNKKTFSTDLCFLDSGAFANSAFLMWRKSRL